jgi:uncharacterized protein HemY
VRSTSANEKSAALVQQAFEQSKTEYMKKGKLLEWLKEKGLSQEEALKATEMAITKGVIRFCYTSSSQEDRGKLVPHYKRLTEEDQMPPGLEEAMIKRLIEKDRKATRLKKRSAHNKNQSAGRVVANQQSS